MDFTKTVLSLLRMNEEQRKEGESRDSPSSIRQIRVSGQVSRISSLWR
jgi:hypothetical protein